MSISIKNLYCDVRDVGKTIKSTKKYFVWEFVLNSKYHKIEVFHSKMSGKKKLCVDAQAVCEEKSYKYDFTYSFKIDKNYFNVIQINSDKYDLRIDNRSFDILMQDERNGKLSKDAEVEKNQTTKKNSYEESNNSQFSQFEQIPSNLRNTQRTSISNPRNNNSDGFFNDQDFDFNNNNNNQNNNNFNQSNGKSFNSRSSQPNTNVNTFANFNEFNNKFSNPKNETKNEFKKTQTVLVDFNEIPTSNNNTKIAKDNKELLNQINFDIFSNDTSTVNNTNLNNVNIVNNSDFHDFKQMQSFNISPINQDPEISMNYNMNNRNTMSYQQPNFFENNNSNNFNQPQSNFEMNNTNNSRSSINYNNNLNDLSIPIISSNNTNTDSVNTPNSLVMNDFKKGLIGSGLVNLDNLFEDKKKSNSTTNSNTSNYNFAFNSGGVPLNYMNNNNNINNINTNNGQMGMNYPINMMSYGNNMNMNNMNNMNPYMMSQQGQGGYQMNQQMNNQMNQPNSNFNTSSTVNKTYTNTNTPFDF